MGRSFLREGSPTRQERGWQPALSTWLGAPRGQGQDSNLYQLVLPWGICPSEWELPDPRKGKGLVAAALPPSLPRALCPARTGVRGWNPRRSSCDSALSAGGLNRGCWPGKDASQRYPPSGSVVALMIQLSSACLQGPALAWEREGVLGLGGVFRGPWSNSSG